MRNLGTEAHRTACTFLPAETKQADTTRRVPGTRPSPGRFVALVTRLSHSSLLTGLLLFHLAGGCAGVSQESLLAERARQESERDRMRWRKAREGLPVDAHPSW